MSTDAIATEAAALADILLLTRKGEPASLAAFAGTALVIQFVRYFGCLPCQAYLRALDERGPEFAKVGAKPIAIGGFADYQARWLHDTGVAMPLLLDPGQRLRTAVEFGSLSDRQLVAPRGLWNYAAAVLSGIRPQRITGDVMRAPGIAILDATRDPKWTYEGAMLGDYPALDEVLDTVRLVVQEQRRDG